MASVRDDVEPIVILAGVAVGGFLLYQIYQGLKKVTTAAATAVGTAVQAGSNAIASPIATAIVWATSGSAVTPTGSVVLPDGSLVSLSNLNVTFDDVMGAATFVYNGQIFWLLPNPTGGPAYDMSGNYHATTVAPIPEIASVS